MTEPTAAARPEVVAHQVPTLQMFTTAQLSQLMHAINPGRVRQNRDGQSYLAQHDVRAHLTRIFGFGMWEKRVLELTQIAEYQETGEGRNGRPKTGWTVVYGCTLELRVYSSLDPTRTLCWTGEDTATGSANNQVDKAAAHDLARKTAVSYALKRCAIDLGDQFGLGLYNSGQTEAFVGGTHVLPPRPTESGAVNQQTGEVIAGADVVSDGHDDEGSRETPPDDDREPVGSQGAEVPRVPCKGCGELFLPTQLREGFHLKAEWDAARAAAQPAAEAPAAAPPAVPPAEAAGGAASPSQAPPPAKAAPRKAAKAAPAPAPVPKEGWPAVTQPGSGGSGG